MLIVPLVAPPGISESLPYGPTPPRHNLGVLLIALSQVYARCASKRATDLAVDESVAGRYRDVVPLF